MIGTIIGILFLAAVINMGIEFFNGGTQVASESVEEGSGCGCVCAVFIILFALSLFSWAGTAPVAMIGAALFVIAIAKGK